MLVAITAFPVLDPDLLAMIMLAVPVPLLVWMILSRFLGARAGKSGQGGSARTYGSSPKPDRASLPTEHSIP